MKRNIVTAITTGVVIAAIWMGCSEDPVVGPTTNGNVEIGDATKGATFAMGPVKGLTTAWHHPPGRTAVPLGTILHFRCKAPAEAEVTWTGADGIQRGETMSIAEYVLDTVGEREVRLLIEIEDDGGGRDERDRDDISRDLYVCILDVVEIPAQGIQVSKVEVSATPLGVDEDSPNRLTMMYFFEKPTVASFRLIAEGKYRTSISQVVTITAETDPPEFAPLIEWRINGEVIRRGPRLDTMIREAGVHQVSIGHPAAAQEAEIEAYSVTITSHKSGRDVISGEGAVTFTAKTDPPGFEDDITWMSSTWYGSGRPVLGAGPSFTMVYENTWRADGHFQWLGVRADNAGFHQEVMK